MNLSFSNPGLCKSFSQYVRGQSDLVKQQGMKQVIQRLRQATCLLVEDAVVHITARTTRMGDVIPPVGAGLRKLCELSLAETNWQLAQTIKHTVFEARFVCPS